MPTQATNVSMKQSKMGDFLVILRFCDMQLLGTVEVLHNDSITYPVHSSKETSGIIEYIWLRKEFTVNYLRNGWKYSISP